MIYKLDEISKKDVLEVGGKAANLGELIKLGFNVPKGFVCTSKENRDDIYNMYNKLNPFILEELIEELEEKRKIALDDNFKNIIFLSYSKHYMLVRNILEMLRNKNKIK